jgi:hypothetical protein
MLGTSTIDANVLADSTTICPVFTGLQQPRKESWTLNETKGGLSSGGFSVVIQDNELGHEWLKFGSTKADGDLRKGIPGVHHVAQPLTDETCGCVELRSDFRHGAASIDVYNTGFGTVWETAVESEADYRINWIGQEAIALTNNVTGTDPELACVVEARGLFNSREQSHYLDYEFGANPLVYDVPPSVVGLTCTVWGCLLNDDNSAMIGDPVRCQWGPISAKGISTRNGMTTIKVNEGLQNLDEQFKVEGWGGGYIARYVFTRDADSPTLNTPVFENFEAPHLTMLEWDGSNYLCKHIWLCAKNTSAGYDTWGDVITALMDELDKCARDPIGEADAHQSQQSGAVVAPDDNQWVELDYKYQWNGRWITQTEKNGTILSGTDKMTMMTGPLAWLFNLGPIHINSNQVLWPTPQGNLGAHMLAINPWFFYSFYTTRNNGVPHIQSVNMPYMSCVPPDGESWPDGTDGDPMDDYAETWLGGKETLGRSGWRAQYFYSWQWDVSADCGDWETTGNNSPPAGGQSESSFLWLNDSFSLRPETDTTTLSVGDILQFGSANDISSIKRFAQGTNNGVTDLSFPLIELSPTLTKVDGYPSPFRYGSGIFFIPGLEAYRENPMDLVTYTFTTSNPPAGKGVRAKYDPWRIEQLYTLSADTLGDMYQAILGYTGATATVEDRFQKNNIIGFTDEATNPGGAGKDLVSMIDWTDLDNRTKAARDILNIKYRVNFTGEINLLENLWNECRLHGVTPVLEWDAVKYGFVIRFRRLGAVNLSAANAEGRLLVEKSLTAGQSPREQHSDTWLGNKIDLKANYIEEDFKLNFSIPLYSSHVQSTSGASTIKMHCKFSHVEGLDSVDDDVEQQLKSWFRGLMRFFAQPQHVNDTTAGIDTTVKLALGREMLVTDRSAFDPTTHEISITEKPAFTTKMSIDWGGDAKVGLTYRFAAMTGYAIAPSALVPANSSTKWPGTHGTYSGRIIECDMSGSLNEFTPSGTRPDFSFFDCLVYNPSVGDPLVGTSYTAKSGCTCGDYAVIFKTLAARVVGGAHGVGDGNLKVVAVEIDNQKLFIEDTDSGGGYPDYGNWNTTLAHIIRYAEWDNVEACQQLWIYGAGTDNQLGTSGDPGMRFQ